MTNKELGEYAPVLMRPQETFLCRLSKLQVSKGTEGSWKMTGSRGEKGQVLLRPLA